MILRSRRKIEIEILKLRMQLVDLKNEKDDVDRILKKISIEDKIELYRKHLV